MKKNKKHIKTEALLVLLKKYITEIDKLIDTLVENITIDYPDNEYYADLDTRINIICNIRDIYNEERNIIFKKEEKNDR